LTWCSHIGRSDIGIRPVSLADHDLVVRDTDVVVARPRVARNGGLHGGDLLWQQQGRAVTLSPDQAIRALANPRAVWDLLNRYPLGLAGKGVAWLTRLGERLAQEKSHAFAIGVGHGHYSVAFPGRKAVASILPSRVVLRR
jgi:hypothetical protein